jgi:hypothetical protein
MHPLGDYLSRTPFWRAKQPPGRLDAAEAPVRTHFDALKLVDSRITGVWLIDADGKAQHVRLGAQVARDFIASPLAPPRAISRYLAETKARPQVVAGILREGGVHGLNYTEFHQIAAQMLPNEIDLEVTEKLDFIQKAFGL